MFLLMNAPFIVKEHSKPKILSKNGGSYLMKLVHTMFYCKFLKKMYALHQSLVILQEIFYNFLEQNLEIVTCNKHIL